MRRLAALIVCASFAGPALAGATAWSEIAPGVKLRLVTSDRLNADGSTMAALELDMPAGNKTYWQVPGETGIPTTLDTRGSTGIAGHSFVWPYPVIEATPDFTDFVYYGSVTIPLRLEIAGDAPVLNASVLMGICSDVCLPATADFSLPLSFDKADAGQEIRIAQALADAPIAWTGPGEAVGNVVFDAAEGELEVAIDPALVDPDSLIADASESGHLFGAPQKSPEPGIVLLPLLGGSETGDFGGKPVTFIFMTPDGPFEVSRPVKASTPGAS